MVSLIPLYTLCLLRSRRKETESLFCDAFFFRQGMGLPISRTSRFQREKIVITNGLITFCIKEDYGKYFSMPNAGPSS